MKKLTLHSGREVVIKESNDGSSTLFVPELNEHYHSTHGAMQESMHVFIQHGLLHCQKEHIHLLEIGFGTGLNAFLTLLHQGDKMLHYQAIEKYPLPAKIASDFHIQKDLPPQQVQLFESLHACPWEQTIELQPHFLLTKLNADLLAFIPASRYDLVYFDAFAPDVQPELWSDAVFNKLHSCMNSGGILTTYCAKGIVRRRLITTGFQVERLPGPPGKREMLRATKK
jgi:tRNA U34 5-methylaminomethyl-2-thiouridine-forming methyltransferase MnmC